MQFKPHPAANITFTKPAEWGEDRPCHDVKAYRGDDEYGAFIDLTVIPEPADLQAFQEGRPLHIRLYGAGMAPMAIWTENEHGLPNDQPK